MELHREPEGKQECVSPSVAFQETGKNNFETAYCSGIRTVETALDRAGRATFTVSGNKTMKPTCQDACQVDHPHFKSFVDQFQRDSQQQLHQQVAHDVLHTVGGAETQKSRQSSDSV